MSKSVFERTEEQIRRVKRFGMEKDVWGNPTKFADKQSSETENVECLLCHCRGVQLVDGFLCNKCFQKYEYGE